MQVKLTINSESILNQLRELGQDNQSGFILSKVLNTVAKEIQTDEKIMLSQNLHIRRPWVISQVKINKGQWATKTRMSVTIEMPITLAYLSDFETGAEHIPYQGHTWLTMPNPKVFGNSIIGPDNPLKVKNLQLNKTKFGIQGLERTFLIHSKETGTPLILQRTSPDDNRKRKRGTNRKTGVRLLYTLIKHSNRPKKIAWYQTATNVIQYRYNIIASQVLSEALASAKK